MILERVEELFSELTNNKKDIVIVGAGKKGRNLQAQLKKRGVTIKSFLDNNKELYETFIDGVCVNKIQDLGANCLYIIAIADLEVCNVLEKQLLETGIKEENIIKFGSKGYEYYKKQYLNGKVKEELSRTYQKIFSKELNWEHPTRYTEILNVEKLENVDSLKTKLADKVEVRKWVKEKIGEGYLIERYHEWEKVEDIDFDKLPKQFVIKLNNGSGRNIIVKDKDKLDIEETKKILTDWFSCNYAFCNGCYEFQYKDIPPRIVCEEYLEGVAETVYDYNIYCFHGEPKYIWCIKGSHRPECQASFYDKEWNMQPFSFGYPKDPIVAPKPEKLEEMLKLSKILCEGFRHVRVDWYNLPDGRVLFGEMTFTSWSGLRRFDPDEYDEYFGQLVLG